MHVESVFRGVEADVRQAWQNQIGHRLMTTINNPRLRRESRRLWQRD